MKKIPVILLLLTILSGFLFQGCGETGCPLNTIAYAHFDFLSSQTHSAIKIESEVTVSGYTYADVVLYDTLSDGTIKETVVKDSLLNDTLYNKEKGLSSFSLPLSYNTRTTYVIHYTEKMRDTIEVTHKNTPFLSDIECGAMMFYTVEKIKFTTNALDSVVTVNPDINNEEKSNFRIYYTFTE